MERLLDRRVLLKTAGASVAIAAAPPLRGQDTAGATEPWKMRLSTSSIHFMELPIEQACQRIADLGYEAVDIWSAHEGCPHLDDVARRLGAPGLRELLARCKLKLCGFSVYAGGYPRYAELLGAAGGGVAIRGSQAPCESHELTSRMRQFLEQLKPLADLAQKHNSRLAIENHGQALLNGLGSLKAFVQLNRSDRVGIALAPYHLQGLDISVPEAIRICGKMLFFFYAWQRQEGSKQLPGLGPAEMTGWLAALRDIDYRGYVNPFAHDHPGTEVMMANLRQSRDYLRGCYRKMGAAVGPQGL